MPTALEAKILGKGGLVVGPCLTEPSGNSWKMYAVKMHRIIPVFFKNADSQDKAFCRAVYNLYKLLLVFEMLKPLRNGLYRIGHLLFKLSSGLVYTGPFFYEEIEQIFGIFETF